LGYPGSGTTGHGATAPGLASPVGGVPGPETDSGQPEQAAAADETPAEPDDRGVAQPGLHRTHSEDPTLMRTVHAITSPHVGTLPVGEQLVRQLDEGVEKALRAGADEYAAADLAASIAAAAPPAPTPPSLAGFPPGYGVVHYHRPNGNYDGWQLQLGE
jgi:hypothetical protein